MAKLIADSSTLILLAKITLLRKLSKNKDLNIWITKKVLNETTVKNTFDAKIINSLIEQDSLKIKKVDKESTKYIAKEFFLDPGEASSIVLHKNINADILSTDDSSAIKTCKILGIPYTTTLNLLIRAKEKNILSKEIALAKLDKLEEYGWYKEDLIKKVRTRLEGLDE